MEYDQAMQDEYILEVQSLERPAFPTSPSDTSQPTEFEKEAAAVHATVQIEEPKKVFQWGQIYRISPLKNGRWSR